MPTQSLKLHLLTNTEDRNVFEYKLMFVARFFLLDHSRTKSIPQDFIPKTWLPNHTQIHHLFKVSAIKLNFQFTKFTYMYYSCSVAQLYYYSSVNPENTKSILYAI